MVWRQQNARRCIIAYKHLYIQYYDHALYHVLCVFEDSNVVLRLLKARKLDLNPSQDDKSEETSNVKKKAPKQSPAHQPVLLFTRLEKECYCCLGRLEWVAVDVQSSPVKFKWELVDFDEFCGKPHFQRILREC